MKTISEKSVRRWVQSVLENSPLGTEPVGPIDVNPVVDPEAAQTDPFDTNFSPQNRAEFDVAIRDLVRDLPDDQMPIVYDQVKDAVSAQVATAADDEQRRKAERSGTLMQSKSGVNVEEAIRAAVRKLIETSRAERWIDAFKQDHGRDPTPTEIEMFSTDHDPPAVYGRNGKTVTEITANVGDSVRDQSTGRSGTVTRVGSNSVTVNRKPSTTTKRGFFGGTKNVTSNDSGEVVLRRDEFEDHYVKENIEDGIRIAVRKLIAETQTDDDDGNNGDEMEWKEMAQKLGHGDKVHGVRHEFGRAVTKMRFLAGMDPDDREVMILDAMNDYIKHLASSGELPPSDVQLLHDHPDMVRELPGFLEFLHDYVKSEMRGKKVEIPEGVVKEAMDVEPSPEELVVELADDLDGKLVTRLSSSQQKAYRFQSADLALRFCQKLQRRGIAMRWRGNDTLVIVMLDESVQRGNVHEAGLPKWVDLSFFKHIRSAVQHLLPGEKSTFDVSEASPEYIQYVVKNFEDKGFTTHVSSGKLVVQKPGPKKAEPVSYPHTFGHPEWFDQLYSDEE